MSSPAPFIVFVVLLSNYLLVNVVNFGSITLIDTKSPFLQLMRCCILNLVPQGHVVDKFAMLYPYRKWIASEKCCFNSSKPKSLIGSAVSQFDTPFFKLISSNLLDFSDRYFLIDLRCDTDLAFLFYDLFS